MLKLQFTNEKAVEVPQLPFIDKVVDFLLWRQLPWRPHLSPRVRHLRNALTEASMLQTCRSCMYHRCKISIRCRVERTVEILEIRTVWGTPEGQDLARSARWSMSCLGADDAARWSMSRFAWVLSVMLHLADDYVGTVTCHHVSKGHGLTAKKHTNSMLSSARLRKDNFPRGSSSPQAVEDGDPHRFLCPVYR